MKRGTFAVALLCAFLAHTEAQAQTATQDINISATVSGFCTIDGNATGTPGSATIPTTNGYADTTPITPTGSPFANVLCNGPSTLLLTSQSGGVVSGTPAGGGFTNIIDYEAEATWNSVTASVDTSTVATASGPEAGTGQLASAGSGNLSVTIAPILNTNPLVAGSYSDTLRITLTPQ